MRMGRPRTARKDLPPGLHFDARFGTYHYRETRGAARKFVALGKVIREAAIREWVKLTSPKHDQAVAGTVGELLDRFLRDLDDVAPSTRINYEFHVGTLRSLWGSRTYAITAADAARGDALRPLDVATHLRDTRKQPRGSESAVYRIGVLSQVFAYGAECGLTLFNPCEGVRRRARKGKSNRAQVAAKLPTVDQLDAAQARAGARLALMIALDRRTGMRQTDLRNLRESHVVGELLVVEQSKTGMLQEWVITPEIRAILDAAAKLPRRARSHFLNGGDGFIFPGHDGRAVGDMAFQSAWRQLKAGFQFRAIRKWAINQRIAAGGNGTDFAGHFDPRTTRKHYDVTPKRVIPL
jgi:integrase